MSFMVQWLRYRLYVLTILVSLLLSVTFSVSAQIKAIDSLLNVLKYQEKEERILTLLAIGKAYKNITQLDEAEKYTQDGLLLSQKISYLVGEGKCYNQLGNIYADRSLYDKAESYYKQSLKIREKIKDSTGIAASLNNLGIVAQKRIQFQKAIQYYMNALKVAQSSQNKSIFNSAVNNIATIYTDQGNYEKAVEYLIQSQKLAIENKDWNAEATSYNNIGYIFIQQKNVQKALEYFLHATKIWDREKSNQNLCLAYTNIAEAYMMQKKYSETQQYYQKAKTLAEQNKDTIFLARALAGLGSLYNAVERHQEAITHLNEAFKLMNGKERTSSWLDMIVQLTYAYIALDQFEKANGFLKIMQDIANEPGNSLQLLSVYDCYVKLYSKQHNYTKAYNYMHLYANLKDSVLNESNTKHINELSAQYENEKKEKEIELLKKTDSLRQLEISNQQNEINRQQLLSIFSIAAFILIGLSLLLIYNRYKLKKKSNEKLSEAYAQIEDKNQQITDSIYYSKRLQESVLIKEAEIKRFLPESFILYRPKDIVSGDFYWFSKVENQLIIAVADCTGHGVPGALMAMVGNSLLNQAVNEQGLTHPGKILDDVNKNLFKTFSQNNQLDEHADGLDISICSINTDTNKLTYAAANHSLYIVNNGQVQVIGGEPYSIGGVFGNPQAVFSTKDLTIHTGTTMYLTSDGLLDQFGEKNKQKFMQKRFIELLNAIQMLDMDDQKHSINQAFSEWKGNAKQTDDVLIWGIKI